MELEHTSTQHGISVRKWACVCEPVYIRVPISDQSIVPCRCRYQRAWAAFQRWPCKSTCNAAQPLIVQQWYNPPSPPVPAHPNINPYSMQHALHAPPLLPPHPSQNKSSAAAHREYHFIFHWPLVFLGLFSIFIFLWVISHRVNCIAFFFDLSMQNGCSFLKVR